ncbi:MAG: Smr/MutS family protein [Anaeroplasmataceae bacterium]
MTINTHDMFFKEAKELILQSIETCYKQGDGILEIIHGYNRGSRIKDWIKGAKLDDKVSSVMPSLTNSGVSYIYIRTKFK